MASHSSKSRRVLVVDDDDDIAQSLQELLTIAVNDVDVRTAPSGEDALEVLRRNRVDLIITDYRMGGMNGLEFLEAAADIAPNVPSIMVTAYPEERLALVALQERRIAHFFRKPFDAAEVVGIVNALLGRYFTPELKAHAFRRSLDLADLSRP